MSCTKMGAVVLLRSAGRDARRLSGPSHWPQCWPQCQWDDVDANLKQVLLHIS